ncbi:MAG: hypothetical protein IPP72_07965 [Chitinophagaceae bacterium]|nr:hypothetical protein [Chitinophagaceae bacterium]
MALITLLALSAGAQKIETSITYLSSIPDPGNNYIVYDRHRKLSIEDFKGKPEEESVAAAITNSGFMFKAGYRNVNGKATLSITVYCSFDKELSWMKQKAKTAYILSHEQHHFDITYIGTLLFIKKLKQVNFNQEKYKEQLHNLYNEVVIDMQKLQNRYDTETNNGILTDKQAMWNIKIDEQLASLLSEGN